MKKHTIYRIFLTLQEVSDLEDKLRASVEDSRRREATLEVRLSDMTNCLGKTHEPVQLQTLMKRVEELNNVNCELNQQMLQLKLVDGSSVDASLNPQSEIESVGSLDPFKDSGLLVSELVSICGCLQDYKLSASMENDIRNAYEKLNIYSRFSNDLSSDDPEILNQKTDFHKIDLLRLTEEIAKIKSEYRLKEEESIACIQKLQKELDSKSTDAEDLLTNERAEFKRQLANQRTEAELQLANARSEAARQLVSAQQTHRSVVLSIEQQLTSQRLHSMALLQVSYMQVYTNQYGALN